MRRREESCLERGGCGEPGGSVGRGWGDSLLHRNLPFGVELHLELHQAGGQKAACQALGWHPQPPTLRPGRQALTSCPGRCCGGRWLSAGASPEPVYPQPSPARPQSTAVRPLASPVSTPPPLDHTGSPGYARCPAPGPVTPGHLAHILLVGDEVVEGEVHHVRARHHSEGLQQEVVVRKVQVKDLPELLALQQR